MGGRGGSGSNRIATVSMGSSAGFAMASPNAKPVTKLSVDGAVPQQVATSLQAQRNNNAKFSDTDSQDYHQLYNGRQYYADQSLSIDQRVATMNYLSDVPESGSMYSPSQNMNRNLSEGKILNANQTYMYNNMRGAMHNLGYNLKLQRYDHDDSINGILKSIGVNQSYDSMSEAQLNKVLKGVSYKTNALTSTSYNDFSNAGSKGLPFTTRAIKFEYNAKARTQAMMPGNGPGGRFGEIVLDNVNNFKITGVKFDGRKARFKNNSIGSGGAKSLVVYVDVD